MSAESKSQRARYFELEARLKAHLTEKGSKNAEILSIISQAASINSQDYFIQPAAVSDAPESASV